MEKRFIFLYLLNSACTTHRHPTEEEKLLPNPQNYDKFYLENLVKWWKNKATKRYTKLQEENRLRNTLEVWTEDTINTIDIIR